MNFSYKPGVVKVTITDRDVIVSVDGKEKLKVVNADIVCVDDMRDEEGRVTTLPYGGR